MPALSGILSPCALIPDLFELRFLDLDAVEALLTFRLPEMPGASEKDLPNLLHGKMPGFIRSLALWQPEVVDVDLFTVVSPISGRC